MDAVLPSKGVIFARCLTAANNWPHFHHVLEQHGLELRERGSGLVIVDGSGVGVKASSVSRDFSKAKLEKQFGPFEKNASGPVKPRPSSIKKTSIARVGHKPPPRSQNRLNNLGQLQSIHLEQGPHYSPKPIHMKMNTVELYARYQAEQNNAKFHCASEISRARARKNQLIESAKRSGRLKRAAIKLIRGTKVNKKVLYALASQAVKANVEQAKKKYLKERDAIYLKYQRCAWADWLKLKATEGDVDALNALRSREVRQNLKGNIFTGQGMQSSELKPAIKPDNITKTGTIIYRAGTSAIRDDGELIKISRGSSEEGIGAALRMAMNRYGECISVNGSDAFKEQIVQVAAELKLPIAFDNAKLELRRQHLIKNSIVKEKNHESRRQHDLNRRRTNRSSNENIGTVSSIDPCSRRARGSRTPGRSSKPHIGSIGQQPPPESKNRLRNLSQLSVVQLSSRSEVLLPSHVSGHMEHQGTQSDNGVRRNVFGAGAVNSILDAADKYIAEREVKRQKIAGIPRHRRYHTNDTGPFQFAGTRQIDGEFLALLKQDECIIVVPVNKIHVEKIKRLSVGSSVILTSKGVVVSKGRSR